MKIAATGIGGVGVDFGANIQEQKESIKGLVDKYGPGDVVCKVLYDSRRPAMRKKVAIPESLKPKDAYAEGKRLAKKRNAARKKVLEAQAKENAEIEAATNKRRAARRAKAIPKKAKSQDTGTQE